ncbi:MAG: DUF3302 domain-containing protein [Gammaproteobacteria bacterium]|nr:DUF3302 domain-containing protein [Gammaproteobacteria bacterium]
MHEFVALGILIFIAASLLFGAIAIVGIPYKLAVDRNHPHQDAIRFAGWVSLFALHSIWPLLYAWSAAYRDDPKSRLAPRFAEINEDTAINDKPESTQDETNSKVAHLDEDITDSVTLLGHRYEVLGDRLDRIEKAIMAANQAA